MAGLLRVAIQAAMKSSMRPITSWGVISTALMAAVAAAAVAEEEDEEEGGGGGGLGWR